MSAPNLHAIAASLYAAGIPGDPTAILARDLDLFEVEFAALEFVQESELRPADWAVLALARAMGRISPLLADEYLGLGDTVSEAVVHRLLGDQLLQEDGAEPARTDEGGLSFAKHLVMSRLFGATPPGQAAAPTRARKLRASRALGSPLCRVSDLGSMALERGTIPQRRIHKARLLFLAEPLLFIRVEDDRQQRHTARHRPPPLPPQDVPPSLRTLDSSLCLPADERMASCGIGAGVAGLSGQLVRIVPGTQWEVRRLTRRVDGQHRTQTATLVLAAFHAVPGELLWRVFLRHGSQAQACPQVNAAQLIDPRWQHPASLMAAVHEALPLPVETPLRDDGAYEVPCDSGQMTAMLGDADRPCDTLLHARIDAWHAGLRVHAVPADAEAARQAFYALLSRNDAALRRDFDTTCAEVASQLSAYWGRDQVLPSPDEAAVNLWPQAGLRAALCMRRMERDLISAYADKEQAA